MKFLPEYIDLIILALIILFGAITHATAQLKLARDSETEFATVDFVILTVISAFAGLVFGLTATLFFDNQIVIILASAVGAFLGIAGLNRIANSFLEFLVARVDKE